MNPRLAGDQQEPQLVVQRREPLRLLARCEYFDLGVERRADLPCRSQPLQFTRHIGLERDERRPIDVGSPLRTGGKLMPGVEEDGFVARTGQKAPNLLGGEAQDRGEPAHHGIGDVVHRRLRGAARQALGTGGVEAVLDDIQVKAAELDHAEIVHLLVDVVEFVVAEGRHDIVLQRERF